MAFVFVVLGPLKVLGKYFESVISILAGRKSPKLGFNQLIDFGDFSLISAFDFLILCGKQLTRILTIFLCILFVREGRIEVG